MSQRDDENDIETRLRAAFMARSEQVTHQKLRPGVVPGTRAAQEAATATASARAARPRSGFGFAWNLSWRGLLVPSMVTAALVIGVGIGVVLPDGGSAATAGAAASGVAGGTVSGSTPLPATPKSTTETASATTSAAPASSEQSFGGLAFQTQDWKLVTVDDVTACVLPPNHAAPVTAASSASSASSSSAKLPCGADALMIKAGVTATAWPVSTVKDKAGWWPVKVSALSDIPCPVPGKTVAGGAAAAPGASAGAAGSADAAASATTATVKTSVLFRSDPAYPVGGATGTSGSGGGSTASGSPAQAVYQEWSATCSDGTGVVPMVWEMPGGKTAVIAVSATRRDDATLLAIVASMRTVTS